MESEDAFFVGPRPKREVEMPRAGGLNSHSKQTKAPDPTFGNTAGRNIQVKVNVRPINNEENSHAISANKINHVIAMESNLQPTTSKVKIGHLRELK